MDKAPDAFRTISEVGEDLDLPQHVLRFWETRFPQIKPLKRGGGRRYYRPDDVELLKGIRHLLYGEGYTIKGVQRILKEEGLRYVQTIWSQPAQADAAPVAKAGSASASLRAVPAAQDAPTPRGVASEARERPLRVEPSLSPAEPPQPTDVRLLRTYEEAPRAHAPHIDPYSAQSHAPRVAPASGGGFQEGGRERAGPEPRYGDQAEPSRPQGLPVSDIRNLQAALFELGECRRLIALAMADDAAADV